MGGTSALLANLQCGLRRLYLFAAFRVLPIIPGQDHLRAH
jgi:hypothetical protein